MEKDAADRTRLDNLASRRMSRNKAKLVYHIGYIIKIMLKKNFLLIIWLLFAPFCCLAEDAVQPLPADQAFKIGAQAKDSHTIAVSWQIQPGYYLYQVVSISA